MSDFHEPMNLTIITEPKVLNEGVIPRILLHLKYDIIYGKQVA